MGWEGEAVTPLFSFGTWTLDDVFGNLWMQLRSGLFANLLEQRNPTLCRQITLLSERVQSESELRGSQLSLTSEGKSKPRKLERQATVVEEEKNIEKQAKEKDKLIQAETVETGRVREHEYFIQIGYIWICVLVYVCVAVCPAV